MITWYKAHRKTILLVVFGLAVLFGLRAWERSHDDAIAQLMADKIMAKHRAASRVIVAKYAKLNAAKDAEIAAWRKAKVQGQAELDAAYDKLKFTASTLDEARVNLKACGVFITAQRMFYTTELQECENLWCSKVALKDKEIAEWKAKDEANIIIIGDLTKRLVKMQLEKRKRLVIGPQVHWGTGGMSIGFGATLDVGLRYKIGGLL